ncbi:unnamed protein product, partial [Amoebophrya sp. A25]
AGIGFEWIPAKLLGETAKGQRCLGSLVDFSAPFFPHLPPPVLLRAWPRFALGPSALLSVSRAAFSSFLCFSGVC